MVQDNLLTSMEAPPSLDIPTIEKAEGVAPKVRKQRISKENPEMQGAFLGAGVTLGLALASKFVIRLFRKGGKKDEKTKLEPTTPKNSNTQNSIAFGSPVGALDFNAASGRPVTTNEATPSLDYHGKAPPPPGHIKQQLQLLREAQEENARMRSFMNEYAASSEKMKILEQENLELKNVMTTLQTQLTDIKSKSVIISNGAELSSFKDAIGFSNIARSVCSEDIYGVRDNGSVDGSASVVDAGQRKKIGGLSQLFAWANSIRANEMAAAASKSPAPSQPSTPRKGRTTMDSQTSDVVQLLNGFGGGIEF